VSGDFERIPPHDVKAEQCVLGGMMLSKGAIADVADAMGPGDHYRPAHQIIHEAILRLDGDGKPADAVAVADHLAGTRQIGKIGGAPYLHTLISSVPAAANAGYYARIVRKYAILRGLIEAGTRITQIGYAAGADEGELAGRIAAAYRALDEAAGTAVPPKARSIADLIDPAIEAIEKGADAERRIATGWADLDDLISGFGPGQLITVGARPGMGKALALDTPLPTPDGWTTMGEIQVGDHLIGADGVPTRVIAATDVMYGHPCHEVKFSDGTVIVADAEHLWLTETRSSRKSENSRNLPRKGGPLSRDQSQRHIHPAVRTTAEIAQTLLCRDGRRNHAVSTAKAVELPQRDLPVDPYVLGAWLGDGHSYSAGFTTADAEIVTEIESAGHVVTKSTAAPYLYYIRGLVGQLRAAGLLCNKHVPAVYLRASEDQRRALLAGLLDTDGSVANCGRSVRFEVTSRRLAQDAHELILSLGYRCAMTAKRVPGRSEETSTCYRLTFSPADKVFRLTRKVAAQTLSQTARAQKRYITDARPVPSVPVRCVQVDNADHLYLASRSFIPTHNSISLVNVAVHAALRLGLPVLACTLEMSEQEYIERILASEGEVDYKRIRDNTLTDDDWNRIAGARKRLVTCPHLMINDDEYLTLQGIRSDLRTMRRAGTPAALVTVDYLQLMTANGKPESRQAEVSEISRGLKLLAREFDVPIFVGSQLNRGPEMRSDHRPLLADLRESGSIEMDSDIVLLLYRADKYEPESAHAGEIDVIVAKNRSGREGTVTLAFRGHVTQIADMYRPWSPASALDGAA
jgi:replicative DNA helicase